VFGEHSPAETFEVLAVGIFSSWRNAERLLSDASLLADAGRLSSAKFLITTAREELAKPFMLVD
jgi:AbiV family abortive infection protein